LRLLGQLPARLTAEQAAWVLIASRMMSRPRRRAVAQTVGQSSAKRYQFFATVDVLELIKDRSWLAKVTNTVNQHWRNKNAQKKIILQ